GVLEVAGAALVDQRVGIYPQVAQHAIGDVGVAELILDDAQRRDQAIGARQGGHILRRAHIGRRADQLGVRRDNQSPRQTLDVLLVGLVRALDQPALLNPRA